MREAERVDLVAATRDLMAAVSLTDVPADDLRRATDGIRRIAAELTAATRPRVVRVPLPSGPLRGDVTGTADPVLGRFNPVAPPLRVTVDPAGSAHARLVPAPMFEGPQGAVHGGYLAMLLDAVMGTLVRSLGALAVTGKLTMRYLKPTPLDRPLRLSARVLSRESRKVTVEGEVTADEVRTVQSTGLFITPSSWSY